MKKLFILTLVVIITSAFQIIPEGLRLKYRIKEMHFYLTKAVSYYNYNSNGYITNIRSSKGSTILYEYYDGKIIKRTKDSLSHTSTVDTLILNSSGLTERIINADQERIVPSTLEYDKDRHLIKDFGHDSKGNVMGTGISKYENGNMIENHFFVDIEKISTIYKFYADKQNTIGYENMGMSFSGSTSKNPTKEIKTLNLERLDTIVSYYYYHYDDMSRIKIKAIYDKHGKLIDSTGYTYY